MRMAIRKRWSSSQLERATQAQEGVQRSRAGRKPKVAADKKERLLELRSLSEKWVRWWETAELMVPKLPDDVHRTMENATASVRKAQDTVNAALGLKSA